MFLYCFQQLWAVLFSSLRSFLHKDLSVSSFRNHTFLLLLIPSLPASLSALPKISFSKCLVLPYIVFTNVLKFSFVFQDHPPDRFTHPLYHDHKSQYHQLCWWFVFALPGHIAFPPEGGLTNHSFSYWWPLKSGSFLLFWVPF